METKATAGLLVLSLLVTGIVAAAIKGPDGSIKEPASRSMVIKMDGAGRQSVKFNDDDEDIDQIGINNGQITEQNNWRHRDTDDIGQIGINGVTGRIKEYNYDPESVNQRRIGKTGSFIDPLMSGGRQVVNFNNDGADIDQIGINNGQITEHNWKRDFGSQGDIGQVGINGVTGRIKEYNYDPTNDIGEIGFNNGQITEHNWRHRDTDGIVQIGMNGVTGRIREYNYDPDHDIDQIGINNGQITEHNWRHRDTDDISQIGINGVTGRIKEYNYDPETVNARLIGQIGLNTGQLTSNSILKPGQTDRQPSIGQIGLDLGKRTENNYVLPAGQSQEQQQALWSQLFGDEGSDEDVIGIYNGGRHCLGYHNGQCGIMNDPIQDIDQLGINNGQVYEFNFGKDGKIKITPEGGLKAPAASSGSSERDRRTETRRPDSNSDRRGEKDNRHGGGGGRPDEKEHSRPHRQRKEESKRKHGSRFDRDDKNKWSRGQGKDSRHRDDAERVADFLADIAEIGFNNGHITEYNYRRRQ